MKLNFNITLSICLSIIFLCNCNDVAHRMNKQEQPTFHEEDRQFANVFKSLDGTWKGEFTILEDSSPVNASEVNLEKLTMDHINSSTLKEINKIDVKQVYTSESPYFQRVVITDTYPDSGKIEISRGINKIEKGKMWCIVNKPNETVIHSGKTLVEHTIIWYQNNQNPQRIEYFQETVGEQFYEIIGYGYYEGDNIDLSPRLWFYGRYERQEME